MQAGRLHHKGKAMAGGRPAPQWEQLIMMSLSTLALGLCFFGLFFAMVAACDLVLIDRRVLCFTSQAY